MSVVIEWATPEMLRARRAQLLEARRLLRELPTEGEIQDQLDDIAFLLSEDPGEADTCRDQPPWR